MSLRHKVAYAAGAITDMIGFHGPVTLVNPIFNIALGLNPTLIGVAKGVCRVWDAFTDPAMGAISDRGWRNLGRRRSARRRKSEAESRRAVPALRSAAFSQRPANAASPGACADGR